MLGRPETFQGEETKFRDWAIVVRSYCSLINKDLRTLMTDAENSDTPAVRAVIDPQYTDACVELYHVLLHLTRGPAMDRVVNAGEFEGLEGWRQLVRRYDPALRSRHAGNLMEIM